MEKASVTAKHVNFVGRPMKGIGVGEVPGIGNKSKVSFSRRGITEAQQLFGQCLIRDMNRVRCKHFLETFGLNQKQQTDAFNAFKDWVDQHL